MKQDAKVVVIGGGIIGCSIAYHLAKYGCEDVVLVEKGELTSGTTFHSVGLVTQFRTSPVSMQLMNYSIQLFNEFKRELGEELGWMQVGSLRLASSEGQLKNLQRNVSRARALGLDAEMISPSRALEIFPRMTGKGLLGAVHIPDDGYLEPNGITQELARRARALGVEVITNNRVTDLELDGKGRVAEVVTEKGRIRTEVVVNAAGEWAPRLGQMVGVNIPMIPVMHQFLTTKPVRDQPLSRLTPVVRDPDNRVYIREEVGGFLVGGFEPNPKAWMADGVPWEFTQSLLPPEWELFEPLMEGAVRRCPELEDAEILRLVNGPDAITPDGHYALGPIPEVPGFFVAAGMSLNGIAGAGGVGKILAEWIIDGEPSLDVHELDVRRFGTHLKNLDYVTEKALEVCANYYHLRYPTDENVRGRPLRKSPLFDRLMEHGAVFGHKFGWERANFYDPGKPGRLQGNDELSWDRPSYFPLVAAEHAAVRERVGLLDMTSFGKIDVSGPGACAFLQGISGNDIDRRIGSLVYTQFLNRRGGIESDVTVTRLLDDRFRVTTGTASIATDLGYLRMHLPDDGSVTLEDVTEAFAVLSLWGPRARDVLAPLAADDVTDAAIPYMTSREIRVAGLTVRANRVSFAGELGWELVVANDSAVALFDALIEAGEPHGLRLVGYKALDSLRLEKMFCYWGSDITPGNTPIEAGLGFCVKFDKGAFTGRDVLEKQKAEKPEQRLRLLTTDGDACVLYGGEAIHQGGAIVGRVTSAGYGHTVERNIALAYLARSLPPGTELLIESFGQKIPARIETGALVDPKSERMRG